VDLRRRLARLDRTAGASESKKAPTPVRDFPDHLGMTRRAGPGGDVWIREQDRSEDRPAHSPGVLVDALTRPVPDDLDWSQILFLDTETTGLAGGTGTVPFMVGVAWWERGDCLRLRQYLLPGPSAESAMLADLADCASRFRLLVTFNGHSYDLPLLRTRAILSRRRGLFAEHGTWDLLPLARRLWGRRLDDCRQGTVEKSVLGRRREGEDIPGARIPQTWIDFVREGDADRLAVVLAHNGWDLDGMAGILRTAAAACAQARSGPTDSAGSDPCWQDRWSLARLAEGWKDHGLEEAWIRAAVEAAPLAGGRSPGPPAAFFADALRMLKRTADWREVERLVEAGLARDPRAPWLHREAAILYEHRLTDLPRAMAHALRCEEPDRVARLERRIDASGVASDPARG